MKTGNHFEGLAQSQNFIRLTNSIRDGLPRTYFYGILVSYTINAIMIGFFLFPTLEKMIGYWPALIIAGIGTGIIQTFRGLIVFTDLLFAESGETSKLQVKLVALAMTIVGIFELWHLLSGYTDTLATGELIGVFVFGSSIIVGGWMMEINFIKQTNEFIFQHQEMAMLGRIEGRPVYSNPEFLSGLVDPELKTEEKTPGKNSAKNQSPEEEFLKNTAQSNNPITDRESLYWNYEQQEEFEEKNAPLPLSLSGHRRW